MKNVLEVKSLHKSFGAVQAVQDFSILIKAGEIKALVGDNGAGKSTIVKMLSGIYQPDGGNISIEGESRIFKSASDARHAGIETVLQDLALVMQQPVYLNLFLGRELVVSPFGLLKHKDMCEEARKLFADLGVNIPNVRSPIGALSGGQRQAVAIARAAQWSNSLVIMDEPTAALGVAETARVENLIRTLSERGTAILLISHNLDQVFRLADAISIMRRGEYVGEFEKSKTSTNEIVSMITGSN